MPCFKGCEKNTFNLKEFLVLGMNKNTEDNNKNVPIFFLCNHKQKLNTRMWLTAAVLFLF